MALRMPYKGMKLGSALPIVIPAPEPEPRSGDVDSRLRGTDGEGTLQAIFVSVPVTRIPEIAEFLVAC